MSLISDHKLKTMVFSDQQAADEPDQFGNIVELREKHRTEDFLYALQTPNFSRYEKRPLVPYVSYEEGNLCKVSKADTVLAMVEEFVYPRLKLLSTTGKCISNAVCYSVEDWTKDLFLVGNIAGISL